MIKVKLKKTSVRIVKWLNSKIKKNQKIYDFKNFFWTLSLAMPLLGFVYWHRFLGYFNISPSIYLTLEDAVLIHYDKAVGYLTFLALLFPLLGFKILSKNRKIKRNKDLLFLNCMLGLILAVALLLTLVVRYPEDFKRHLALSVLFFVCCLFINFWKGNGIYLPFGFLLVLLYVNLGKLDAKRVLARKVTFDMKLENQEVLLRLDDKSSFLVANTTAYIFVYNRNSERIRPVLKTQVALIEFPLKINKEVGSTLK